MRRRDAGPERLGSSRSSPSSRGRPSSSSSAGTSTSTPSVTVDRSCASFRTAILIPASVLSWRTRSLSCSRASLTSLRSRRNCSSTVVCAFSNMSRAALLAPPALSSFGSTELISAWYALLSATASSFTNSLHAESAPIVPSFAMPSTSTRNSASFAACLASASCLRFRSTARCCSSSSVTKLWKVRRKSVSSMARYSGLQMISANSFLPSAQVLLRLRESAAKDSRSTPPNFSSAASRARLMSSFSFFSSSPTNSLNRSSRTSSSSTFLKRASFCSTDTASLQRVRASMSVFSASMSRKASLCLRAFCFWFSFSCFSRWVWYSARACLRSPCVPSASQRGSAPQRSCASLILAARGTLKATSISLKASTASECRAYVTTSFLGPAAAAAAAALPALALLAAAACSATAISCAAACAFFFTSTASTFSLHALNSSGAVHSDSVPLLKYFLPSAAVYSFHWQAGMERSSGDLRQKGLS
mmetsp:Transcript_23844/g.52958  ORF Transcript_23844/g.52958 Transcript_23844/m.52958 type:complete len:477 (+) Transcript_23844:494-1924(+)